MNNPDGTGQCDRCGRDLPNTGIGYCVMFSGMTDDGQPWVGHLCTIKPGACAGKALTAANLAARIEADGSKPVWFSWTEDEINDG